MASFLLTLLALFLYSPGLGKGLATTSQHWQHTSSVWGLWSLSLVTVHRSLVSKGSQLPVLSGSLGPVPAWERDAKRGASGGQLLRMCIRSYLEPQSSWLQSNTLKAPAFHCLQSLKFIPSAPVLPVGWEPSALDLFIFLPICFPPMRPRHGCLLSWGDAGLTSTVGTYRMGTVSERTQVHFE